MIRENNSIKNKLSEGKFVTEKYQKCLQPYRSPIRILIRIHLWEANLPVKRIIYPSAARAFRVTVTLVSVPNDLTWSK